MIGGQEPEDNERIAGLEQRQRQEKEGAAVTAGPDLESTGDSIPRITAGPVSEYSVPQPTPLTALRLKTRSVQMWNQSKSPQTMI